MRPIPNRQAELLEGASGGNFSLYFARMTEWENDGKNLQDAIIRLGGKANGTLPRAKEVLLAIHKRQKEVLQSVAGQGGMVWEFRARLRSPFVSGLGSGHPTETGMILDRNSGLPYIPASDVKGVLRLACALAIAKEEPKAIEPAKDKQGKIIPGEWEIDDSHPLLRRYFGDTETKREGNARGQLVFLDAFPIQAPQIKTDIMNPHFVKYYQGGQDNLGPLETENPIPIKCLTVDKETEFVFRCFTSPLPRQNQQDALTWPFDQADELAVQAIFNRALGELGFGAKTAVGYGLFDAPEIQGTEHFQRLAKEVKEQKRQEEENRLYPWRPLLRQSSVDSIDNWGDLKQKLLEKPEIRKYQTQTEVAEAVKAAVLRVKKANPKKWDTERDTTVASWLESAGVIWDAVAPQLDREPKSGLPGTPTEANRVEAAGFRDFGDWNNRHQKLNLAIEQLTRLEAQSLKTLFTTWGVKEGKGSKKETWKKLEKRLRELTSETNTTTPSP